MSRTPRKRTWGRLSVPMSVLLATLAFAQEPVSTDPENEGAMFKANVNIVTLDVAVTYKDEVVRGLDKSAFNVTVDGYRQPISLFDEGDAPLSVIAVFDRSRSMTGSWSALTETSRLLPSFLRPDDELALITFNENVTTLMPFEKASESLADRVIERLKQAHPDGLTAMHDAIAEATRMADTAANERRVILLISDGADSASRITKDAMFDLLQAENVSVYSIGLFGETERGTNAGILKALARTTGGAALFEPKPARLHERMTALFETLRARYFLGVPVEAPTKGKPQVQRIRVTALDSKGNHLKTQHRTEFIVKPEGQ